MAIALGVITGQLVELVAVVAVLACVTALLVDVPLLIELLPRDVPRLVINFPPHFLFPLRLFGDSFGDFLDVVWVWYNDLLDCIAVLIGRFMVTYLKTKYMLLDHTFLR